MTKLLTKTALLAKLKLLAPLSDEQRNNITCSLIGHSRIQHFCFGYYNCGRCGVQMGDSLGGAYSGSDVVVIDHACPTCKENFKTCTWRDKLFVPNPFPKKGAKK